MALQKSKSTNYGVNAEYWKVIGYNYIQSSGKYEITLGLWIDQTARNNLNKPLEKFIQTSDNPIASISNIYTYLKNNMAFFSDAVDVTE